MILSFHPIISGDENIICAGRPPGSEEKAAIRRASAIILPQGVREDLYRLCRSTCDRVWPNFDSRFNFPGKIGQALLLARHDVPRPRTVVYPSVRDFHADSGVWPRPFLLKSNGGGEGQGVFPVHDREDETRSLELFRQLEKLGRGGFVRQELIDHGGRDLRVIVIGEQLIAYWRWAPSDQAILTNVAVGGRVDFESDPELMKLGSTAVRDFAARTDINLAAFDLLFDRHAQDLTPLFIEINYFFGRHALGGTKAYYRLLQRAAHRWLKRHGLKRGPIRSRPRFSDRD